MATLASPAAGDTPAPAADEPAPSLRRRITGARPFFENKARAFWTLQAVGWSGYLLLRGVSSISNGPQLDVIVPVIVEAIVGYCLTLLLSTLYGTYRRMKRVPGVILSILTLLAATLPTGEGRRHSMLVRP